MAVEGLAAAARAYGAGEGDAGALAAGLRQGAGKENGGPKTLRDAALLALKAAQQRLAAPGDAAAAAAAAAVGGAALDALAATGTQPSQLAAWRYNLARRLVSAKAYDAARVQAWLLFQQLRDEAPPRGKPSEAAEAASLAVGTALTLVLCCVEGGLLADADALGAALAAAEVLPRWLSQLKPEEAGKHAEAAYRYLYKAAVGLLERRAWCPAADACGALLAAAGGDGAAQRRALAAAGKLAGHMPEEHAAAALAALATRASSGDAALGAAAAQDLLGLLSSAAQRASTPAAACQLQQAAATCAASCQPLLQTAALLLPALVVPLGDSPGSSAAAAAGWEQPVSAALQLVAGAVARLELAAGQPLPLAEQQRQLALLEAAALTTNALRRALAAQLPGSDKSGSQGGVVQALGGAAAARTAAAALELLAAMVGVSGRLPASSSLADQGHAAAVALVTAARLRAACVALEPAGGCLDICSGKALARLLGWDLSAYWTSSELPPARCAVEAAELAWLASALFNAGVDLSAAEYHAAAASAMSGALAVTALVLRGVLEDAGASSQARRGSLRDTEARLAEYCRKCMALATAQQQAGDTAGALGSLGHGLALVLHLGAAEPSAWQPLVQAFVRVQAELPEAAGQAAAAAAPAKRGRGAASKKVAAAAAGGDGSSAPASDILLARLLQQHACHLPPGSRAAVMELELQCRAAAAHAGDGGAGSAACLAQRLLRDVFPAAQQPVEHAGVLLALHQLGLLAEDGLSEGALLERAASVLDKAPGGEAAATMARVRCAQALHSARQLARQALLEQQLERQRSHAAASTSAVGSQEQDAAAVGQLAGSSAADAASWHRARQHAAAAVEALSACDSIAACSPLHASFGELAWLLGLQGTEATAGQLLSLLPAGNAVPSASGVLAACLFPGGSSSSAELQQATEAAAAEGSRSSTASLQRAALHGAAAEAFAADGDMVPALFHAAEAHRLLAALFHGDNGPSSCASGAAMGMWSLAAAYLGSLLQLGQLFEAAGLADEALHALREGQRLAVAVASHPLAALFGARLADVYGKQGQSAAAAQAVGIAEEQLAAVPSAGSSLPAAYCRAAVQLARAQLGIAGSAGSVGKAAWQACQEAAAACEELAAAAPSASIEQPWCAALHAAAMLTVAEASHARGDLPGALQHAAATLETAGGCGACSAARHQRAAALLFLGRHSAPEAESDAHVVVWGLGAASRVSVAEVPQQARDRGHKAPAKQPAARGRSKAAAAAEDAHASPGAGQQLSHLQHLWAALEASRGQLVVHRAAAAALAEALGRQGRLHLAAWLLHSSMGAAMRLQYQLVLHSRKQQLALRQRRAGGGDSGTAAQQEQLEEVAAALELGIDWQLVAQLAGAAQPPPAGPARGRKAAAPKAAVSDAAAALAALEQHAMQQLRAWQAMLPAGTVACSVGVLPSSGGGSLVVSRLPPASSAAGNLADVPPLLVSLPAQQLSASLSQHPIRALRMDDDDGDGPPSAVSSVQSVLDEMAAVLADSGRSMRELATDTKEQQREWWRARLALEDRLAALVKHLDSGWLGPWRCLLLGEPAEGGPGSGQAGQAAAQSLCELLEAAGRPASPEQEAVLSHAAAVLARHAGSGGMSAGELRQAAHQLCHAAGLACTAEQQRQLEALLAAPRQTAAAAGTAAAAMPDAGTAPARARKAGGAKAVKFADDVEAAPQQQQPAAEPEEAPPAGRATSRGRRPAAVRGRRTAAAAANAADVEPAAEACSGGGGDASPAATLGLLGGRADDEAPQTVARDGLCQVFDSLTLEEAAPSTAAAGTAALTASATTARSSKHRSRLRMMQAGTPGPATARKAAAATTAPRPAREPPATSAKTAPPPAAPPRGSEAAAGPAAGPVLLVLDGALQALPWESAPGLLRQQLHRMPSLACAAATARRCSTSVDLSSAFYALNPSGDLEATQAAFQPWFEGMRGWQGKAGSAPTAAELAAALSSRQLFLYCGHGGGEQYISAAKLRSLERCSAALLMGCSSGRLRVQQHYEPAGAVLAYLLAGCPAAVANLWDVTDRDIDRFSQALLTAWIAGAGQGGDGADMCGAMAAARGVCKLPHLVGAAPVCYGLPARLVSSG